MSLLSRVVICLAMVLPVACGSGSHKHKASSTDSGTDAPLDAPTTDAPPFESGLPDAPPESGGPFAPAPHDPAPQVVSAGGPVLKQPRVVPVFFQNDPAQSVIEQFLSELAKSSYWGATTSEYGVGKLTIAPSIVTTATPPTSYTGVDQLASQIAAQAGTGATDAGSAGASGDGGLPDGAGGSAGDGGVPDGAGGAAGDAGGDAATPATTDLLYVIFLPPGVVVDDPGFGQSCVDYGGYHSETFSSGVAYALLPRCQKFSYFSGLQALTTALSHELIEAATDPYPSSDPAYNGTDDAHAVWNVMPIGEIGDMCAYEPQSYDNVFGNFYVQRVWSNTAAAAGHDPCVPNTTQAYFNAVPDQPDDLVLKQSLFPTHTRGVKIAVGQTRTIDVHLFSDAPRGQWLVQAQDAAAATGGPSTLSLSLSPQYGKNGDVLKLTITRTAQTPMGGSEFILWSRDQQTHSGTVWFGYVGG